LHHTITGARTTPRDFAVVGSGISGMSAAWLLSQKHRVTLYEQDGRVGGHTNTVEVDTPRGRIPVDTGFIVYNELNYPNLTALFAHLDVATKPSNMFFSVSLDDGGFEYSCNFPGFVQPACLIRADYWQMVRDLLRFYRETPKLLGEPGAEHLSLEEYVRRGNYSDAFIRYHLLPMGAAIWSSSVDDMRHYPALSFARFCDNHGLLKLKGRPQWRTVCGGSREYVRKLTAAYKKNIFVHRGAARILRDSQGITIIDATGERHRHDAVIIAAHADQALAMLDQPTNEECAVLGRFRYRDNLAVLHSDSALMPKARGTWAAWNYVGKSDAHGHEDLCVTYWMNKLQSIDRRAPLFVTLNPVKPPREDSVHASLLYAHPIFDTEATAAQNSLWDLQGVRHTWFCGAYFGSGFHEDGLQAGLAAAEDAGGVRRPWRVQNESARIGIARSRIQAAA
jgi:predicted NAD/FAD-binding protein